jgi:hypothetical protein
MKTGTQIISYRNRLCKAFGKDITNGIRYERIRTKWGMKEDITGNRRREIKMVPQGHVNAGL